MRLKNLLIVGILFSTAIVHAQTDFRQGYIIKTMGDTIYGFIDYRSDLLMGTLCRFKDNNNTIIEYSPYDISAFRFIDNKYFVSREINNRSVFLEFLIKGKVNIYYLRDDDGDHYYIDKEGEKLLEIPYEEGIRYVDQGQRYYISKTHIGILNYYMQEAPQFKTRIQSMRKPEHINLIKLAKDYHNAVCKDEECTIFEKKHPFLKINIEGVAGTVNFENVDDFVDKTYFRGGVLLHFWMPRSNEKLYFKTGLLYSNVEEFDGKTTSSIKIPAHIGYLASKTYAIRPSFSIGLISPSYSLGFIVRIDKNAYFGVQGWTNFYSDKLMWVPAKLYNYSFFGNLYIEL